MAKLAIKKASTDVTVYVFIQASNVTTGAGLTGLVYNTTDLVGSYVRPLAARQALSLATLAAVDTAHTDGGFKEIDATNMPGVYRLDLPDAVCATGVNSVVVMLKGAANMAPVLLEIQLTDFDLNDASPNVTVADIANDAITAAAYDESTAFPIKKADATTTELARLDSASSYKADVSGLATPTNITAASGITLAATQGAITWAQQKIVANVESEGALDISNSGDYGIGLKVHGTQFGQMNTATADWSGAGTYNYGPSGQLNEGENVGQLNKGQAGSGQRNSVTAGYGQENISYGGHGVYNKGSAGYKNVDGFDSLQALEASLTAIKGAGWVDENLTTIDANVDSILADTGTDGVVLKAAGLADDAVNEIVDQVWNEAIADHTTVTTFGGKNQKGVPSETINDYKADVSGLATPTNITAGTITTVGTTTNLTNLPAVTTDWLTAAGVKADAVTKIQTGLATPTNITAGTITTVTNLTNAPTNGDLTATMKSSVTTAASSATPALSASGIDAILDEVVVGSYTMRQLLAVMGAALAGKVTGGGTTAITFRGINDASNVIVATVDANGNRSAVTVTV